jgi:hypothetical protein
MDRERAKKLGMTWIIFWIKYDFQIKKHRLREFVEFLGDDKL